MTKAMALSLKAGQTIKVYQKIKETDAKGVEKERLQIFEGIILGKHGRKEMNATITVRKESHGVGVEKIYPVFSPNIDRIEIVSRAAVKHAKLGFLRKGYTKKLKEVV